MKFVLDRALGAYHEFLLSQSHMQFNNPTSIWCYVGIKFKVFLVL